MIVTDDTERKIKRKSKKLSHLFRVVKYDFVFKNLIRSTILVEVCIWKDMHSMDGPLSG